MSSAFPRAGGVLLPLTSLPARHGLGDLGASAHDFVDWCAAAGLTWWQMLPVGPLGPGDSPYSSTSAFAGEPLYLSLDLLAQEGLLADADLEAPAALGSGRIDYRRAAAFKRARLGRAFEAWRARRAARDRQFERFCADASGWLDPWAERASDPLEARFLQHRFQVPQRTMDPTTCTCSWPSLALGPVAIPLPFARLTSVCLRRSLSVIPPWEVFA